MYGRNGQDRTVQTILQKIDRDVPPYIASFKIYMVNSRTVAIMMLITTTESPIKSPNGIDKMLRDKNKNNNAAGNKAHVIFA